MGALLLAFVAAMIPFLAEPDVAYAQTPLSADATLSGLIVVGGPGNTDVSLSPSFTGGTSDTNRMFTGRMPFTDTGVVITPTASEASANDIATDDSIIRINGTVVASGAPHNVSLASGAGRTTTITIVVTAPQRTVTETYTVKMYRERQSLSDNSNLASLSVSGGNLTPGFSPGTDMYNARVQSGAVTLSYGLSDTGGGASVGTITVDSAGSGHNYDAATKRVTLGAVAAPTAATGGTTTITVPVIAEDGSPSSYTIEVYRIRSNRQTNANLASPLTLTAVGATGDSPARVGDGFTLDTTGATTDYSDRFNNDTTYVTVVATKADAGAIDPVISPPDALRGEGPNAGHQVALTAGAVTTITIRVTAEDTAVRKTYTIEVYKERATRSDNNNLNSLRLSAGTLTPAFNRNTRTYDAQTADDVEEVTVSYTASDSAGGSTVSVEASGGTSSASGDEVTLAAAGTTTTITLTVTAEDTTEKEYVIRVYRLRPLPAADASLSALDLNPAGDFTQGDTVAKMYNVKVAHNISAISVIATATTAAFGATVAITPNGGNDVPLMAGAKTLITITVTAEDRATTDTYMVYVYRGRAETSDDATLSALSLSAGALSPAFMSDAIEYKARVANDVDEVTVSRTPNDNAGGAGTAVATSTDADCSTPGDNVSVPGDVSLSAGANTNICVTVTAEDGTTKVYTIIVYRVRVNPNTDASLMTFSIAEKTGTIADLDGDSAADTDGLDLKMDSGPDVVYRVRQVTVTTMADIGSIVTILPADSEAGTPGHQVDLTAGAETMITVEVMPEDSAAPSKTYTANVYRKNIPGSEFDDATLSSLMLSGAVLTPAFASGTTEYTAAAAFSPDETTVTATTTHIGANVAIVPDDENLGVDGDQVSLTAGAETTITVTVTAEDGTTKDYAVKVTRPEEASSDATLESLTLSDITLSPEFDPAITAYTAEAEGLETTMVEAMATHPVATIEGTGEVSLTVGENAVEVMVTAEDGETTETYTVTVTVEPLSDEERLRAAYDMDSSGHIDLSEVSAAIDDYFEDILDLEEVSIVIDLYFE